MPFFVLRDCKLYVGGFDVSGHMNNLGITYEADAVDVTAFGEQARRRLPGLRSFAGSHRGFWDGDAGKVDQVLFNRLGGAHELITVAPTNGAEGERSYVGQIIVASYSPGGAVGEVLPFTVDMQGEGPLVAGTIMVNGTKSASGNSAARQLGQVEAGKRLYAGLHVLQVQGTSPTLTVKVQSSADQTFTTPVDRITFQQVTAIGAQWASPVDGPITHQWWRVNWAITGTNPVFSIVVSIGIQ